jgi:hypothetical protein
LHDAWEQHHHKFRPPTTPPPPAKKTYQKLQAKVLDLPEQILSATPSGRRHFFALGVVARRRLRQGHLKHTI